jgi:ferritin-like metal-binding protein YciE
MKQCTLNDLFVDQLRDVYNAENQLVKALPKMAKAASAAELRDAFTQHLEQTRGHVGRLEEVAEKMGVKPKGKTCHAMEGLVEEGKEWMEEDAEPDVMDAGLIAAAQKVEHYEIAAYGCLCTWAKQLGDEDVFDLLQQTLAEEKETDELLTQLAESSINQKAQTSG